MLKRGLAAVLAASVVAGAAVMFVAPEQIRSTPPEAGGAPKSGPDDWHMFGGSPARNMANTQAKGLPAEWSTDENDLKNVKWVADLGSKAYGGPIVAGGRVFIGTNNQNPRDKSDYVIDPVTKKKKGPLDLGVLMCFNEADGKFLWQAKFKKLGGGRVRDWPLEGLCSSPVVEGDRLYYTTNRCEVVCADVATGKVHWALDMIDKLGVFPHNITDCSPLLVDNNLYVITANGVDEDHINVPSPKAPSFIKVDKTNGKVLWQDNEPTVRLTQVAKEKKVDLDFFKTLVNRGELIQHGQWSNASYAVVDGQAQVVFPGGDGWVRAFDPNNGKLLWKFDCNPKDAEYELAGRGTRSDFIATPVIYKNRVYIGVGQDPEHNPGVGHLWCIDMTKRGDVSPELVTNNNVWPPETKKNPSSALVWHYGGPISDPAERTKVGRNYYFGRTMSTCAIHDGICYAGELLGVLHCLDAETGKVYWTHDTRKQTWSSPYLADGKVYFGNDDDLVYVFTHGKQKKLLAQNDMGGHVRASPVAANGVLFVMTENKLYAIAEGAGKKK
jgi:outer membrane protein assembly factor BamB